MVSNKNCEGLQFCYILKTIKSHNLQAASRQSLLTVVTATIPTLVLLWLKFMFHWHLLTSMGIIPFTNSKNEQLLVNYAQFGGFPRMVRARNAAIPAARTEAQLVKSTVLVSQSHGFESRSSANVFQALFPQLCIYWLSTLLLFYCAEYYLPSYIQPLPHPPPGSNVWGLNIKELFITSLFKQDLLCLG